MLHTNIWIADQAFAQQKVLIYALGGGNGHIQRAHIIAQHCSSVTIMHQKKSPFSSSFNQTDEYIEYFKMTLMVIGALVYLYYIFK